MADPISATALFSFLNSAIKVAEYAVKIYGADSENGVFVRMIHSVRHDLEETERLLCAPSVKRKLTSIPGKLKWIKGVVLNTKSSLNEIGRWVDRVRADKVGYGSVSFENRVRWAFNDHEKVVNRRMELGTCHQALSTVLSYLTGLEEAEPTLEAPTYSDATFFDDVLSPRQKKRMLQDAEKMRSTEKRFDDGSNEVKLQSIQPEVSTFVSSGPGTWDMDKKVKGITSDDSSGSQMLNAPSSSTPSVPPEQSSTATFYARSSVASSQLEPQQWPTKNVDTLPITKPSSAFIPIVSVQTPAPESSIAYMPLPVTVGCPIFPTPSSNPAAPSNYGGQADLSYQSCKSTDTCQSSVYAKDVAVGQTSPAVWGTTPYQASPQAPPQFFSATNYDGPINPYGFISELDSHTEQSHDQGIQLKQNVSTYPAAAADIKAASYNPISPMSPPINPIPVQHYVGHVDSMAELAGNFSELRTEERDSLSEMPANFPAAKSWSTALSNQQSPRSSSKQQIPSEMPGDTVNMHSSGSGTVMGASLGHQYTIERWQNTPPQVTSVDPASNYGELSSHTALQARQIGYEYTPSGTPWSSTQPLAKWESESRYPTPYQAYQAYQGYQAYTGPDSTNVSQTCPISPVSTVGSPQPSWQEQRQALPPATPFTDAEEPAAKVEGQDNSLSRSTTVGEARRRNQRHLLELMSRGAYG